MHPVIRRAFAPFIAQPLNDLLNISLKTASIFDDWCSATVCPIFTKGHREDASNYRPVSLTSITFEDVDAESFDPDCSHI